MRCRLTCKLAGEMRFLLLSLFFSISMIYQVHEPEHGLWMRRLISPFNNFHWLIASFDEAYSVCYASVPVQSVMILLMVELQSFC